MPETWIFDPNEKRRISMRIHEDVRVHRFHDYAEKVASYPKGKEFVNASPSAVKNSTARKYNNLLEGTLIKPSYMVTKTWARHCTPTEDFMADITSTGQHMGARVFNRIDQAASRLAELANREPVLPSRRDRPVLKLILYRLGQVPDLSNERYMT